MTAPDSTKPLEHYRLPLDAKATHYDVTVRTDLEKLDFDGFVKIEYVLCITVCHPPRINA